MLEFWGMSSHLLSVANNIYSAIQFTVSFIRCEEKGRKASIIQYTNKGQRLEGCNSPILVYSGQVLELGRLYHGTLCDWQECSTHPNTNFLSFEGEST